MIEPANLTPTQAFQELVTKLDLAHSHVALLVDAVRRMSIPDSDSPEADFIHFTAIDHSVSYSKSLQGLLDAQRAYQESLLAYKRTHPSDTAVGEAISQAGEIYHKIANSVIDAVLVTLDIGRCHNVALPQRLPKLEKLQQELAAQLAQWRAKLTTMEFVESFTAHLTD